MSSDSKRIKEIFLAAVELPDQLAQIAFLDQACDGDSELRQRVEELLGAHDPEGSFLGAPAVAFAEADAEAEADADVASQNTVDADSPAQLRRTSQEDQAEALGFLGPPERPGSLGRLGHYEVLQLLGQGGFGIVLRAFDDILQRVVAIKVMATQLAATSPARKRFLREARSSAQVRHENVVQVYEVAEKPLPYLVMEFIPGETLQQRLDRKGPLEIQEILRIGRQIAEGLAAAHATDLIHRDIKPGNVLLEGGNQRVKITDFGLARAADDASMSQSGTIAGTPMYMAPEQALGQPLDQRVDLFSLGSVLYQMASGRPPFRANTTLAVLKRVAEETPRNIREVIPETPQWLCDIISKLHAKNPNDRFQSAREVADVLADCEAQLKEHSRLKDLSLIPTTKTPPTRSWMRGAAAAALVLSLAAIGLYVAPRLRPETKVAEDQSANPSTSDQTPAAVEGSEAHPAADFPSATAAANARGPQQKPLPPTFQNDFGMEFALVPRGKSWLGGGKNKLGATEVTILTDFYLGKYEVTQAEWKKVMGDNPSSNLSDKDDHRLPVETVSWDQCQIFLAKLNASEQGTGWVYRLPDELEWEYACRGGPMVDRKQSAFDFYFAEPTNSPSPAQANFDQNDTREVGSYEPNSLGLYDMHGNVHEWCRNALGPDRIHRGGCWGFDFQQGLAGLTSQFLPSAASRHLGLRVARVPDRAQSTITIAPLTAADIEIIAALPAAVQIEEVRKELRRRNPGFDGTLQPTIENDVVTGVEFSTNQVSDISPVRAFRHLTALHCRADGVEVGRVSDLKPLQGMQLVKLKMSVNPVSDLTPLQGMPLAELHIDNSRVADLAPLEGMPLRVLNCSYTKVSSLASLEASPLAVLWCNHTEISDLAPLQNKPLEWITIQRTKVKDISPLKGMPLSQIYLDYLPARDRDILRSFSDLRIINDLPSAEFWQKFEAKPIE